MSGGSSGASLPTGKTGEDRGTVLLSEDKKDRRTVPLSTY